MNGILVINKPKGFTSHDVVDFIRKRFDVKKVGHAGALDPIATGVLILLIGKATKLSYNFLSAEKEYIATLLLGRKTDTQDITGRILEEKVLDGLDKRKVEQVFKEFLGISEQIPPMVSAKKYKGKKLYELARKGKIVDRKPCRIEIKEIDMIDFMPPQIHFHIICSKGTYIRTLCEDIGRALGYPACMSQLTRIRSGRFLLDDSQNLEKVSEKDIQPI